MADMTPGRPMLPYGHQWIEPEDIAAVAEVLRSDWLTTGPKVPEFEQAFAAFTGAVHAELAPMSTSLERFSATVEATEEAIVNAMA